MMLGHIREVTCWGLRELNLVTNRNLDGYMYSYAIGNKNLK